MVMPAAMVIALWFDRAIQARRRFFLGVGVCLLAFLIVLPLCLHNKHRYGYFNVSSSFKYNYAALIVGPAKKRMDGNDGPKLLSMWKEDVGEDYETKPPFEVANIAAHAATRWALAHPGITLRSVIKGQLSMLFAPDRSSWAPGVSFLHPGPLAFHVFAIVVSLFRLFLSCLAVVTLIRWRSLLRFRWLPIYFLFTIVAHVLGVGAVGEGRYIAPVSPFIDFLAALTLCATPYLRGRFSASTEPGALSPSQICRNLRSLHFQLLLGRISSANHNALRFRSLSAGPQRPGGAALHWTYPAMPIVELQNIRKVYDQKVAVEGLTLKIEPGTMFGLLGPNGSGKTSSIRMMIGMTVPDSGTVKLFGQPFTREALSRVGYLPEERGLYKKMKVIEQLIFLGQLHGLDEATARRRSLAWCERMEITEAIEKKTEELSKGMQQKIQFIAALLHEPDLIIMDEPFSGLDPVNAELLMDTLVDLRKQGKAILFSTHRMDQVEKLCDAIAIIYRGRLVLQGSVREIKERYPRNRVQMIFTGDSSFLQHPGVADAKDYAGIAEITLTSPEAAQPLLAAALAGGAQVNRFEVMEPTLEDIFISTVKNTPEFLEGGLADA